MTNIVAWISVGLVTALAGVWFLSWGEDVADAAGWLCIGVGGMVAQVGVVAAGVFIGLQERDRARA